MTNSTCRILKSGALVGRKSSDGYWMSWWGGWGICSQKYKISDDPEEDLGPVTQHRDQSLNCTQGGEDREAESQLSDPGPCIPVPESPHERNRGAHTWLAALSRPQWCALPPILPQRPRVDLL